MKVIFHLDLDAFFASAHQSINEQLKNKPVVVANTGYRSIITAASYEAKNMGIKVPMPLFEAKKLVPNLIAIPPQFALYNKLASALFNLIATNYTTKIEVASIDECYIDVSTIWQKYQSPRQLAQKMQQQILQELNLPCSIGIGANKFVAKMASPLHKPMGITIVKPGSFAETFWALDVEKCLGVGIATTKILKKHDIFTIGDLANAPQDLLTYLFKKRGVTLKQNANGEGDDYLTMAHNELQSVGNSLTFTDGDKKHRDDILKVLYQLTQLVATRTQARNLMGYVISVAIKTAGNYQITKDRKQKSLALPICHQRDIYRESVALFDELWNGQSLKFIGVTLHKLIDIFQHSVQSSLLHNEKVMLSPTKTQVNRLISDINHKMATKALTTTYEKLVNIKKQQHQSRYLWSDLKIKHHN